MREEEEEEEGEEEEEEEGEQAGEGKMMLKIDEITHFLRIVKSQTHHSRICVSEAQTSVQPYEIFFKDKKSNYSLVPVPKKDNILKSR